MGWLDAIGAYDPTGVRKVAKSTTAEVSAAEANAQRLDRGTLMLEVTMCTQPSPVTLLQLLRPDLWDFSLSIQALPRTGFALVHSANGQSHHAVLACPPEYSTDMLRLNFSWNSQTDIGLLTLEHDLHGLIGVVSTAAPAAMPRGLVLNPRRGLGQLWVDRSVSLAALSDQIEPVGLMPGLVAGTRVPTPSGPKRLERLVRGDLVITAKGHSVPVLHTVKRHVPAISGARPIWLRAPYFGLGRDILAGPNQHIVFSGSEVEYLFGAETVVVPARHLAERGRAKWCDAGDYLTYHQLILPNCEEIIAEGCRVETMNIGRLRRRPEAHALSPLQSIARADLPEHVCGGRRALSAFEAMSLVSAKVA